MLSTNGNTRLGGDDIDAAIVARLKQRSSAVELSANAEARLREAAIDAKHRLSTETSAPIRIPFFDGATSFSYDLTRTELDELARPIVDRTRAHCVRALADAKLSASELDEVILVGGVTRMPLVQSVRRRDLRSTAERFTASG